MKSRRIVHSAGKMLVDLCPRYRCDVDWGGLWEMGFLVAGYWHVGVYPMKNICSYAFSMVTGYILHGFCESPRHVRHAMRGPTSRHKMYS